MRAQRNENERELWVCRACGARTSAEQARSPLLRGWELLSLARVGGHRPALCPACSGRRPAPAERIDSAEPNGSF